MRLSIAPLITSALALVGVSASGAEPYTLQHITLLQPDFVMQQRTDSDGIVDYIKAINAAATATLDHAQPTPSAGFVVLAVRPDGTSKAWLDFDPVLPAPKDTALRSALERVAPLHVRDGVVVIALEATLWGALPTHKQTPWPPEWKAVADRIGTPLETGDLVDLAWPEKPVSECTVVYMRGGKAGRYDAKVHAALGSLYRIVDIDPAKRSYESPRPVEGRMPSAPLDHESHVVHGLVSLAYAVTARGVAGSPTVIHTDGPDLTHAAKKAVLGFRFDAGKVDGEPACVAAVQEFDFRN